MKKYICIPLIFSFIFNINTFANDVKNENIKTTNQINKTTLNNNTFINNGAKYSIIDNNSVALESFNSSSAKNIVLPNLVEYKEKKYFLKEIKENAFSSINKVENITLNDSLEKINNNPFANLANLKNIKVSNNSINFISINGVLFTKNKEILIAYPNGKTEKTYTVPPNVSKIGYSAFKNNSTLENVYLNSFVTELNEYAFANTSKLNSVKDTMNLKKINNYAFSGSNINSISLSNHIEFLGSNVFENSNINNFTFPEKLTYVPESTFYNCKNLKYVTLTNKITTIKNSAFYDSSIENINVTSSVKEIQERAFANSKISYLPDTSNLETIGNEAFLNSSIKEIKLSDKFKSLGKNVFLSTNNLEKIDVSTGNTLFESYNSCLFTKDKKELLVVPANLNISKFLLPDNLGEINLLALLSNNNLESFEVSKDNEQFYTEDGILYSKDKKTLIKFPAAKKVENFAIPDIVENISQMAFYNAKNISGSFNIGSNIKVIDKSAFLNSSISNFSVSNNNYDFSSLDGILYNKDMSVLYYCPPNSNNKEYTLAPNLKTISPYAFTGCSLLSLKTNSNLTNIDNYAFWGATIGKIDLNYNLKNIGNYAFENSNIIRIEIPKTVETIGKNAFKNCKELTEISFLGNKIKSIGDNAFENCYSLTKINVPKSTINTYKNLIKNSKANLQNIKEI